MKKDKKLVYIKNARFYFQQKVYAHIYIHTHQNKQKKGIKNNYINFLKYPVKAYIAAKLKKN